MGCEYCDFENDPVVSGPARVDGKTVVERGATSNPQIVSGIFPVLGDARVDGRKVVGRVRDGETVIVMGRVRVLGDARVDGSQVVGRAFPEEG